MCTTMGNYPWQSIDPKDYIHLESTQSLTMQNVRILTKLYKPIIGGAAYSFYQSLFSELDFQANKKSTSVSKLLTKMDIGVADFYHARIRLEGIGLLRIYRSEEVASDYIYQLNTPLTAKHFLEDSLLRTLLMEKLGKVLFQEEIKDLTTEVYPKENYKELTRSFIDVFHFDLENTPLLESTDFTSIESDKQLKIVETIENIESFDYDFFKQGLNKHFIRQDSLTGEIKELIYTYHVVYGIDELTMQTIVLESADVDSGQVNKNKLTSTVQRLYLNKQKARNAQNKAKMHIDSIEQLATESAEENKSPTNDKFSASELAVIQHAKKTAPAHYLDSIKEQKDGFVTSNETWVLKELVEQSPLSKEVINIMLHYILVIRKSVVLDKNYAMTIANDWAQSGVKSAEDAIVKIKEIYSESKTANTTSSNKFPKKKYNNRYRKTRKKETLPDWAKEKATDTKEDDLLSSREGDALKIRLEQIRKKRELKEDS